MKENSEIMNDLKEIMRESFNDGCIAYAKSLMFSLGELRKKEVEYLPVSTVIEIIEGAMQFTIDHDKNNH